jgi:hypothetical protein
MFVFEPAFYREHWAGQDALLRSGGAKGGYPLKHVA